MKTKQQIEIERLEKIKELFMNMAGNDKDVVKVFNDSMINASKQGYQNAIDDFSKKLKELYKKQMGLYPGDIDKIKEEMKQ